MHTKLILLLFLLPMTFASAAWTPLPGFAAYQNVTVLNYTFTGNYLGNIESFNTTGFIYPATPGFSEAAEYNASMDLVGYAKEYATPNSTLIIPTQTNITHFTVFFNPTIAEFEYGNSNLTLTVPTNKFFGFDNGQYQIYTINQSINVTSKEISTSTGNVEQIDINNLPYPQIITNYAGFSNYSLTEATSTPVTKNPVVLNVAGRNDILSIPGVLTTAVTANTFLSNYIIDPTKSMFLSTPLVAITAPYSLTTLGDTQIQNASKTLDSQTLFYATAPLTITVPYLNVTDNAFNELLIEPVATTNTIVSPVVNITNPQEPSLPPVQFQYVLHLSVPSWNYTFNITSVLSGYNGTLKFPAHYLIVNYTHYTQLGPACSNVFFNVSGKGSIPFGVLSCGTYAQYVLQNQTNQSYTYSNFTMYINGSSLSGPNSSITKAFETIEPKTSVQKSVLLSNLTIVQYNTQFLNKYDYLYNYTSVAYPAIYASRIGGNPNDGGSTSANYSLTWGYGSNAPAYSNYSLGSQNTFIFKPSTYTITHTGGYAVSEQNKYIFNQTLDSIAAYDVDESTTTLFWNDTSVTLMQPYAVATIGQLSSITTNTTKRNSTLPSISILPSSQNSTTFNLTGFSNFTATPPAFFAHRLNESITLLGFQTPEYVVATIGILGTMAAIIIGGGGFLYGLIIILFWIMGIYSTPTTRLPMLVIAVIVTLLYVVFELREKEKAKA